jgi:DNA-binding MarR family transcriptional regulator
MTLTPRQLQVLQIIHQHQCDYGLSPTYSYIAKCLKVCTITVFEHLNGLEKKLLITRVPHRSRSIRLTDLGMESLKRPIRVEESVTSLLEVRKAARNLLAGVSPEAMDTLARKIRESETLLPD